MGNDGGEEDQQATLGHERQHVEEIDRSCREQTRFLDFCIQKKIYCTLMTATGKALNGYIHGYDYHCILFGGLGKNAIPRLIEKTYIGIIIPSEKIELFSSYRGMGTAKKRKRQRNQNIRSKFSKK